MSAALQPQVAEHDELVRIAKLAAQKVDRVLESYRLLTLAKSLDPSVLDCAERRLHHDVLLLTAVHLDLKELLSPDHQPTTTH